jgi:hypothetical protein
MLRPLLSLLFVSLVALPAQTVETIGGTTSQPSGANRGKGSLYRVDTSVYLLDFEMHLNVPSADTLTWFLYRHHSRTGVATLEWTQQVQVPGGIGAAWYSTGPIAMPLVAGNYYVLGAYWTTNVQYFYTTAVQPPLSFGAWQRAHTFTGSLPATVTLTGSDIACYYQRFTTIPVGSVVNTGTGCSAIAPAPRLVADDFFAINQTSTIELVDALPTAIALFGFANGGALPVPIPLFGCSLWLDISSVITFVAVTSATGYANFPIGVPNDPALSGLTLTSQGLVFGPTSIDMSNAVSFTVQ